MPLFKDIIPFTQRANYRVNVSWDYLEGWLKDHSEIDLNPDFQRGHVWTMEQKERYVEFILRGGLSSRDIYFNYAGWMSDYRGPGVLVDGKQRLDAVREFMDNTIHAFGYCRTEYTDRLPRLVADFTVHVNDLRTRSDVLQWYLDLNTGGVIHTSEEIERVKALLEAEKVAE